MYIFNPLELMVYLTHLIINFYVKNVKKVNIFLYYICKLFLLKYI